MSRFRLVVRALAGFAVAAAMALIGSAASAQDAGWRIAKVSGQAWIVTDGVSPVALVQDGSVQPGAAIRTGANGRVLLVRGKQSMLLGGNTALTVPSPGEAGMSTVQQQSGTILFDVDKRDVQHFEVETPFLAAVVKGTQFRVSVDTDKAQVEVLRGQVQVADFRSGQYALVQPGQSARATLGGKSGLDLSGSGRLGRIEQGPAQAARIAPLSVPDAGLTPNPVRPRNATPATEAGLRSGISTLVEIGQAGAGRAEASAPRSERSGFGALQLAQAAPSATPAPSPSDKPIFAAADRGVAEPDSAKRVSADEDIAKVIAAVGKSEVKSKAKPVAVAFAAALGIAGAFSAGIVFMVARSRRKRAA
jgi:hypothetical protein